MSDAPKPIASIDDEVRAAPQRSLRRFGWVIPITLAAVIIGGGSAALYWLLNRQSAPRYVTQKVSRGSVVRTVTASGAVNPVITVQVGTYVSGVIQARHCDYNTKVKAGQLCAKIDSRPYEVVVEQNKASLAVARAQLVKDKANLAYAKVAYERNKKLAVTKAVSQDTLDASKNALDQAQAQIGLDEATISLREAELHAAEINLGYTDIVSPVDGTVVSRNVETGQTVAASFQTPTLFLIATDLTTMQVDANVSESDVGSIKIGSEASFTVESFPDRPFVGRVMEMRQSPQTIQNVVTYDAVISAPNPDTLLKPGMTATVRIVVDKRNDVLRVPDQAFRYSPSPFPDVIRAPAGAAPDGSGAVTLWVLRNGEPRPIAVIPGLDDDANTEIVKGDVREGDEIIVSEEESVDSRSAPARQ